MRLAGAEAFDPVITVHDTETVLQHLAPAARSKSA
jgi:hypothetical protein